MGILSEYFLTKIRKHEYCVKFKECDGFFKKLENFDREIEKFCSGADQRIYVLSNCRSGPIVEWIGNEALRHVVGDTNALCHAVKRVMPPKKILASLFGYEKADTIFDMLAFLAQK